MHAPIRTVICALLVLSACGEAPRKQAASEGQSAVKPCTTPEQAGLKAAEITRKLVERRKQARMTDEDYAGYNAMMSAAFQSWAETQDLKAYCTRLDRVAAAASLSEPGTPPR